jgi:hypothetical protein
MQTYWGAEYEKLKSFFTRIGVSHLVCCPHTHQQNGAAERKHLHIIEVGLSLLSHASMPLNFGTRLTSRPHFLSTGLSPESYHCAYGDEERRFLGWASKPLRWFSSAWLFGPQNHRDSFLVWASKSTRLRFVSCATKPTEGGWCGTHVEIWREASRARVSQSGLKAGGGATAGGAHGTIAKFASESS